MAEPRNVEAIRGWFTVHRPDVEGPIVDRLIGDPGSFGVMAAGFEAGRHFQAHYPHLDPMNVAVYDSSASMPAAPKPEPTPAESIAPTKITTALEPNVPGPSTIKTKSVWLHRRTQDECTVVNVEGDTVTVKDSFGDARPIPEYLFRQSYNPKA